MSQLRLGTKVIQINFQTMEQKLVQLCETEVDGDACMASYAIEGCLRRFETIILILVASEVKMCWDIGELQQLDLCGHLYFRCCLKKKF